MDTKERRADANFKVPETSEYQTTGQRPDIDRALTAPGAAEAAADDLEQPTSVSRGKIEFFVAASIAAQHPSGGHGRQPLQPHRRLSEHANQPVALALIDVATRQHGLAVRHHALLALDQKPRQATGIAHAHDGGRVGRRMIVLPGWHDRACELALLMRPGGATALNHTSRRPSVRSQPAHERNCGRFWTNCDRQPD
ncbi:MULTISPECIES: hypothetical protein [unclassified Bradyrhizobium]|uniref:hypothetical protein n=1 Tax=unclassified Bradyrhizobium TaxID=2631580 RepID=UPI0028E33840|nr:MULTISPECIES: hypothetical protein [unclassified Bradyrhizobium]